MMITFLLSGMEHFAMKSSTQGDPGAHGMLGTIGPEKEGSWLYILLFDWRKIPMQRILSTSPAKAGNNVFLSSNDILNRNFVRLIQVSLFK